MWKTWLAHRYRWYRCAYNIPGSWFNSYRAQAVANMSLQPGMQVLVVGAGTGLDLDALPIHVSITLVDTEPSVLRMAQQRALKQGKTISVCVADARQLPFKAHQFDVMIAHLSLTVMFKPAEVGKELERVVKPGGYMSVLDLFEPMEPRWYDWGWRMLYPLGNITLGAMHYQLPQILDLQFWQIKTAHSIAMCGRYQWWLLQAPQLPSKS